MGCQPTTRGPGPICSQHIAAVVAACSPEASLPVPGLPGRGLVHRAHQGGIVPTPAGATGLFTPPHRPKRQDLPPRCRGRMPSRGPASAGRRRGCEIWPKRPRWCHWIHLYLLLIPMGSEPAPHVRMLEPGWATSRWHESESACVRSRSLPPPLPAPPALSPRIGPAHAGSTGRLA